MRGKIDLKDHKLAGLYVASARRVRWKRTRPEKMPDEVYRQLWRIVDGAIRDTFENHPEYLTERGRHNATRSCVKRVVGSLHGYATQVARGRSGTVESFSAGTAADMTVSAKQNSRWATFVRASSWVVRCTRIRQWRHDVHLSCLPKFDGDQHD